LKEKWNFRIKWEHSRFWKYQSDPGWSLHKAADLWAGLEGFDLGLLEPSQGLTFPGGLVSQTMKKPPPQQIPGRRNATENLCIAATNGTLVIVHWSFIHSLDIN
jgi:hypothetical protein